MPACDLADKIIWCSAMKSLSLPLVASVDRAIAEIRQGGAVLIKDGSQAPLAILSAEIVTAKALKRLETLAIQPLRLVMTARRAAILGLSCPETVQQSVIVSLQSPLDLDLLTWLVDPLAAPPATPRLEGVTVQAVDHSLIAMDAAVTLLKLARLLPAAIVAEVPARTRGMRVSAQHIQQYQSESARTLTQVTLTRIPLKDAENASIAAFRPADGGTEHLAIIIGELDTTKPVLIRLHSECFTGDLLGSLRCDCGDQLRGAIAEIAQAGSGILLYLAQEGRGIGLINKLRAYNLQDQGFDTMDANQQLGFDNDERIYLPAAQMLALLHVTQVRLMTNNPLKIDALAQSGIHVVERVPHVFPSNDHNIGYLQTKALKGGHLF